MMRPLMYRGKNLLLYADEAIVVVYKPAGLAVQTKKMGEKDLESLLRTWQAGQGSGTYIGVVHRLDQPVEGVMVLARTKEAAAALNAQAAGTDMQKIYVAVTQGVLPEAEGQLTDFLLRDGRTNTSRVVDKKTAGAKKALLDYKILAVTENLPRAYRTSPPDPGTVRPCGNTAGGGYQIRKHGDFRTQSGRHACPLRLCSDLHPSNDRAAHTGLLSAGQSGFCGVWG